MPTLQLENGTPRTEVLPETGGGLLCSDPLHDCDVASISRSGIVEAALYDPRTFACFPLVPWSNRIGGGRSPFRGRTIGVPHTHGDEPYLLYGHSQLMSWHPVSQTVMSVELAAMADHGRPFRYLALQRYALAGDTLNITLTVRNGGSLLPFGLGMHPSLPRTPDAQLCAGVTVVW